LNRGDHVQYYRDNENDTKSPKELARTLQEVRVGVDRGGSAKYEQVSERVQDDESNAD
jgi:hypothetical protein